MNNVIIGFRKMANFGGNGTGGRSTCDFSGCKGLRLSPKTFMALGSKNFRELSCRASKSKDCVLCESSSREPKSSDCTCKYWG